MSQEWFWISLFHFVLPITPYTLDITLSIFLLQESFHLVFCLHLCIFLVIDASDILLTTCPSPLFICPYHFIIFSVIFYANHATVTDLLTCSFLILSILCDTTHPPQHPHLIYPIFFLGFSLLPTFLPHSAMLALPLFRVSSPFASYPGVIHNPSHNTPLHFFQFPHAALTLCLIDLHIHISPPPLPPGTWSWSPFSTPPLIFSLFFDLHFLLVRFHMVTSHPLSFRTSVTAINTLPSSVTRYPVMSTSLPAHRTTSSTNIIDSGISFLTFAVNTSITIMNKNRLSADPWCSKTSSRRGGHLHQTTRPHNESWSGIAAAPHLHPDPSAGI